MSNNISPVLKTIIAISGIKFAVNRDSEVVAEVEGLKNCDPRSGRNYIALFPGVDVIAGDLLVALKSQEEFLVTATEHEYVEGQWFQDRAYYGSEEEDSHSQVSCPPSEVPAESEQSNLITEYLNYLSSLIKIKSSGSGQDYSTLLLAVENTLSSSEISKASLAEYSQLLQENEWLSTALGTILVSWVSS